MFTFNSATYPSTFLFPRSCDTYQNTAVLSTEMRATLLFADRISNGCARSNSVLGIANCGDDGSCCLYGTDFPYGRSYSTILVWVARFRITRLYILFCCYKTTGPWAYGGAECCLWIKLVLTCQSPPTPAARDPIHSLARICQVDEIIG